MHPNPCSRSSIFFLFSLSLIHLSLHLSLNLALALVLSLACELFVFIFGMLFVLSLSRAVQFFYVAAVCLVSQARARNKMMPLSVGFQRCMALTNESRCTRMSPVSHTFQIGINRGEQLGANAVCFSQTSHVAHEYDMSHRYSESV